MELTLDSLNRLEIDRLLIALERIAAAQERMANHLEKQREDQIELQRNIGLIMGEESEDVVVSSPPTPTPEPEIFDSPSEVLREADGNISWFVDTRSPGRPVMVRLENGTSRPPTDKERMELR